MNKLLELKNITKTFNTIDGELKAIENIDLDLKENEFLAIVGSSGCGKSTLLNIIANLEKPTSGEIKFLDNVKIGYMFQNDCLFPWLTIYENCLLGTNIKKTKTKEIESYVEYLLKKYNLWEFKNKYPSCLSGGMRQRVALIRTLAIKPDILLLDEPFSALDYSSRLKISNDVYEIIKNENKSAIIVTHDIEEAISLADKVYLLSKRPTIIKKIYEINLINKSPLIKRKEENFMKYVEEIWSKLNE